MEVFTITPASSRPIWFLFVICMLLLIVLLALAYTAYSSQNSRVELDDEQLRLIGDFWGREIALSRLNITQAKLVDLTQNAALYPKRRSLGTGLSGYTSGWFRLANGEKSLVYLTNRHSVVYIPTYEGYSLLLSLDNAQGFVNRLQEYSQ